MMINQEPRPTFNYNAETTVDCALCWRPVKSALFVNGSSRPMDWNAIQLNICDDCLLNLFNSVPLLSGAMRETILQEAVGDLASAG